MSNEKTIEKEFKIEIDELFPKFQKHLEIKNNNRILFSGKFGIGKTYFLNEFFKNEENYEVFHLFPINYQITSNENIIEFLKYDILIELMKNKDIFKNDNNEDVGMIEYIKKDFNMNSSLKNTVSQMIDPIPQIGKILGKPLKTTLEFDKKFQEFKKGDSGIIEQFLKENDTETDCLSQILKNKIIDLRNKKQSVLILDDLERIDPEHIFRILNIFSAHFDSQNEELPNKFGFDKIILVADVRNLKSIFYHKYGEQTDSNGYFDKFFSKKVFEFKNEEIIAKVIDKIISKFKEGDARSLSYSEKKFLENILLKSLELDGEEKLNLRQLLKGIKFPLLSSQRHTPVQQINDNVKVLISIFGGIEITFIAVLKKIKNNIKNEEDIENDITKHCRVFSFLLLKIIYSSRKIDNNKYGKYSIEIKDGIIISAVKTVDGTRVNISELFFDLLIKYVEKKFYKKEIEVF